MKLFVFGSKAIVALFAGLVIVSACLPDEVIAPRDHATRTAIAALMPLSVAYLYWLLAVHITGVDMVAGGDRDRLRAAAASGAQSGFFKGIATIGFVLVATYSLDILGYPLQEKPMTGFGRFVVGIVFLFLGLVGRARGVISHLLRGRIEAASPVNEGRS